MGLFGNDISSEQLDRVESKLDFLINEVRALRSGTDSHFKDTMDAYRRLVPSNLATIDKMETMAADQEVSKSEPVASPRYFVKFDSGSTSGFPTKRALAQAYGISPATISRHMRNQHTITKETLDRIIDGRDNRKRQGNNTTYHVMRGKQFYKTYQTTRELLEAYHVSNYTLYKYLNNQYQIQETDLLGHPVKPHVSVKEEPVFNLTK